MSAWSEKMSLKSDQLENLFSVYLQGSLDLCGYQLGY